MGTFFATQKEITDRVFYQSKLAFFLETGVRYEPEDGISFEPIQPFYDFSFQLKSFFNFIAHALRCVQNTCYLIGVLLTAPAYFLAEDKELAATVIRDSLTAASINILSNLFLTVASPLLFLYRSAITLASGYNQLDSRGQQIPQYIRKDVYLAAISLGAYLPKSVDRGQSFEIEDSVSRTCFSVVS